MSDARLSVPVGGAGRAMTEEGRILCCRRTPAMDSTRYRFATAPVEPPREVAQSGKAYNRAMHPSTAMTARAVVRRYAEREPDG